MVDGHPAEPARELAGACGNCERGWIIGADGTPIEKCPCHRGYRPPHLDVVAGTDAIEAG